MLRFSECKELAHFAEREQLRAILLRKGTKNISQLGCKEAKFMLLRQ